MVTTIHRRSVILALLGLSTGASPARADRPGPRMPNGFTPGGHARVTKVLSGDRASLEDGRLLRLAGVRAPRPGDERVPAEPLAADATAILTEILLGRTVGLHLPKDSTGRWGGTVAHLVRAEGDLWVQGELLRRGWVRVRTFPGTATGARIMLDLERTARAGRHGLWKERYFRIRNPGETWGDLDSFQIVEGRVVDAAVVRGVGYLNFGPDWRRDFTLRMKPGIRRQFERAGITPSSLIGRRTRARGWVFPTNGPMIELSHVEQLEALEE